MVFTCCNNVYTVPIQKLHAAAGYTCSSVCLCVCVWDLSSPWFPFTKANSSYKWYPIKIRRFHSVNTCVRECKSNCKGLNRNSGRMHGRVELNGHLAQNTDKIHLWAVVGFYWNIFRYANVMPTRSTTNVWHIHYSRSPLMPYGHTDVNDAIANFLKPSHLPFKWQMIKMVLLPAFD